MARQWFDSSEPVAASDAERRRCLARGGSFRAALVAAAAVVACSGLAPAVARAETPAPAASPVVSSEDAQGLPPYDLERVNGDGAIRVGDRLELKVAGYEGDPTGLRIAFPEGGASPLDQGWDIVDQAIEGRELKFTLVPVKAGKLSITGLVIQDASGKSVARAHPYEFEVASTLDSNDPNATIPEELKPPVGLAFPTWAVILLSIALLAVLSALGWLLWEQVLKRRARAPEVKGPPKSEDALALEALLILEKQELFKKGQYKGHYFRVSEILKTYFGMRYRFDALESTSDELIAHLEDSKIISPEMLDRIETLFHKLDRVKFTDYVPTDEEAQGALEEARALVRVTRRPPTVMGAGANAV